MRVVQTEIQTCNLNDGHLFFRHANAKPIVSPKHISILRMFFLFFVTVKHAENRLFNSRLSSLFHTDDHPPILSRNTINLRMGDGCARCYNSE